MITDEALVRRLLAIDAPDLAGLPVAQRLPRRVTHGATLDALAADPMLRG